MSYFLANCSEVAINATYNEINVPGNEIYLLNVVGYSEDLQRWIPGPRYRLNGKTKNEYQIGLEKIIDVIKKRYTQL